MGRTGHVARMEEKRCMQGVNILKMKTFVYIIMYLQFHKIGEILN